MKGHQLVKILLKQPEDIELRVGDVSEGSDLHASVGAVVMRGGGLVLLPGDDDIWRDETLATKNLSEILYIAPTEEELFEAAQAAKEPE